MNENREYGKASKKTLNARVNEKGFNMKTTEEKFR